MTEIQAPLAKASMALGTGAGSSAVAILTEKTSFLPHTLPEYLACLASILAIAYTSALFVEWVWKKVVKGGFAK